MRPDEREKVKPSWFSGHDWHLISMLAFKMKPNKKQWIFYVIAGSEVIPNEVAAHYEWQAITFIPLVMIVAWATIRFLSAGKLEG